MSLAVNATMYSTGHADLFGINESHGYMSLPLYITTLFEVSKKKSSLSKYHG